MLKIFIFRLKWIIFTHQQNKILWNNYLFIIIFILTNELRKIRLGYWKINMSFATNWQLLHTGFCIHFYWSGIIWYGINWIFLLMRLRICCNAIDSWTIVYHCFSKKKKNIHWVEKSKEKLNSLNISHEFIYRSDLNQNAWFT